MLRLIVLLLSPALFAGERFTVDHRAADIGGKQGLMDIPSAPVLYKDDLESCRVILAPEAAHERRFSFPCGTWYVPPTLGRYLTWLEDDAGISRSQGLLSYAGVSKPPCDHNLRCGYDCDYEQPVSGGTGGGVCTQGGVGETEYCWQEAVMNDGDSLVVSCQYGAYDQCCDPEIDPI